VGSSPIFKRGAVGGGPSDAGRRDDASVCMIKEGDHVKAEV